jgi:hypothetical protein
MKKTLNLVTFKKDGKNFNKNSTKIKSSIKKQYKYSLIEQVKTFIKKFKENKKMLSIVFLLLSSN